MDTVSEGNSTGSGALGLPLRFRIWMLLLSFFPLVHLATLVLIAVAHLPVWARIAGVLGTLLVLPPLLARLAHALAPPSHGRIAVESGGFLAWWATTQFQLLFNRIPMIEEILRIFPGLYSFWLRLWGSRIGALTFWAPGVSVIDREYLDLGDNVVFGAGVRLNGHVILRNRLGRVELAVAPIKIGSGALVGGYCLLTAGTEIAPGEFTRAHLLSPPFTVWHDGKRFRGDNADSLDEPDANI
jgi:hypothetical protein